MLGPIDLMMPPLMLGMALATMPFTLVTCLLTRQMSDLTSWSRFKRAWFKQVYTWFGPASKPLIAPAVEPLLNLAYGTVIEVGPAGGTWMSELAAAARVSPGRIKKIYGVEPNTLFHPELLKAAKSFGLSDIYEPVAAYAQDLEQKGIQKGSIDTIITVHVLCSVGPPTLQETIVRELYDYLKPGGQWLVYEHVASRHAPIKIWQKLNNILWSQVLDGCDITRSTEEIIRNAGEWESEKVGPDPKEGYFESLPHTIGWLVKKK